MSNPWRPDPAASDGRKANSPANSRKAAIGLTVLKEDRYRDLLDAAPDALVVVDEWGDIVVINVQAQRQFRYSRDELVGLPVTTIVPEGFAERLLADDVRTAGEALAQRSEEGVELRGLRKDGTEFPIELTLSRLESSGELLVTGAIRDITSRKQNEAELRQTVVELGRASLDRRIMERVLFEEKERAEVTLNSIGDAVVCTDIVGNVTFLNVVAQTMSGWPLAEATGQPVTEVLHVLDGTTRQVAPSPTERAVGANGAAYLSNAILVRRDNREIPIEDSVAPIHNREGQITGAVSVFRDVSAARAMAVAMVHTAQHDFLTGLPNRTTLHDRIGQAIAFAARHRKRVAVLFLDLDGFKHINDSLGHPIGDKLLQSVAGRLVECVRGADTVSRQGGDEFVVLLSEVQQLEDAAITARRMLRAVMAAHQIEQHELRLTVSIGVSVYPDDGGDAETLVKNADTAMYQAKENGRQGYQFFKPAMNVRAIERQAIEEGLRGAVERREFALHYQPKIDLRTGAVAGAEALVRWSHPTRGNVPPTQFISIAEDTGLILPIGAWILREACAQAQAWVAAGLPATVMAVNVSGMEFRNDDFVDGLFAILDETGFDPSFLELELTESVLMQRPESAVSMLYRVRERQIRVAVDDFGTGYSSLSYLRKFPIDTLKIDQSFVRQISTQGQDAAMVTAVIAMAQSLKLRVIAEGVEKLEEVTFLRAQECDAAQGYYFSPPVLPHQFARLLKAGSTDLSALRDQDAAP